MHAIAAVVTAVLLTWPAADRWTWPVDSHRIIRDFTPPTERFGAGHRGVDLAGEPGERVRAVAAGTVSFVGSIGGTPVISIDHGRERSTYQPVTASVEVGDAVDPGQVIGRLIAGHRGCSVDACLHLGRREGAAYLDPAELLGGGRFVLIDPRGPVPSPPPSSAGVLLRPVNGSVTSGFGRRTHPITGVVGLHDGIDFGAPCGTPVRAAESGTVVTAATRGAFGQRIEIEHPSGQVTSYSHLSRLSVRPGASVARGDTVGAVGTTGSSTGCHLHFSVHTGGSAVDPAPLL